MKTKDTAGSPLTDPEQLPHFPDDPSFDGRLGLRRLVGIHHFLLGRLSQDAVAERQIRDY